MSIRLIENCQSYMLLCVTLHDFGICSILPRSVDSVYITHLCRRIKYAGWCYTVSHQARLIPGPIKTFPCFIIMAITGISIPYLMIRSGILPGLRTIDYSLHPETFKEFFNVPIGKWTGENNFYLFTEIDAMIIKSNRVTCWDLKRVADIWPQHFSKKSFWSKGWC